jgi:hypothetical protein
MVGTFSQPKDNIFFSIVGPENILFNIVGPEIALVTADHVENVTVTCTCLIPKC